MAPDRHSMTELHRSTNDTSGANIAAGRVPKADGSGGVEWGAIGGSTLYLNVIDYGAVGDGVANDTAAIEAAIAAAADYQTIFFPKGTYKITATISIAKPVRLLGDSAEPNWFDQATVISMATANTTALSVLDFEGEISIERITIKGPGSASSGRGLYSAANVNLTAVAVRGFYDGLYIDDSLGVPPSSAFYNHIRQCWFNANAHAGIVLHDKVNNTDIVETYFAFQPYGVFADGGGYGVRIARSSFEVHSVNGILIDGSGATQSTEGLLIDSNYFEQLASGGSATADISIGPSTLVKAVTILSGFHVGSDIAGLWHIDANHVEGLTVVGARILNTGTEAGSIRVNATNGSDVVLVNVRAAGTVSTPATTRILDETDVAPSTTATANAVGSSKYLARADHVHATGTPSGAAGGDLSGTYPNPAVVDDSHSHTSATAPGGGIGPLLLASDKANPIVFDDILQASDGADLLYASEP